MFIIKGELDIAIKMLTRIVVDDDFIFFKLGDAEKLSSSSRVLAKITPDITKKYLYYKDQLIC